MVIFSGGVPAEDEGEHHTVSIHHGGDAVALDFTSKIVDFVTITNPTSNRGEALIVLAEEELLAFDLTNPKSVFLLFKCEVSVTSPPSPLLLPLLPSPGSSPFDNHTCIPSTPPPSP
jgi:hypothetical protein